VSTSFDNSYLTRVLLRPEYPVEAL